MYFQVCKFEDGCCEICAPCWLVMPTRVNEVRSHDGGAVASRPTFASDIGSDEGVVGSWFPFYVGAFDA